MNRLQAWFVTRRIPNFEKFNPYQKRQVYSGLIGYGLTSEQVYTYAIISKNADFMRVMKKALARGVPIKNLEVYREMCISAWRLQIIVDGILEGMSEEQIFSFANSGLTDQQAFEVYSKLSYKLNNQGCLPLEIIIDIDNDN